jgi:hypothetical protein
MKLFLSYANVDQAAAASLRDELEQLGVDTFDAGRDVLPGDNFFQAVSDALESCDGMVVLLSPAGVRNANVLHEVSFALGSPRYANRVFPVVAQATDPSDIPWYLRTIRFADLSRASSREVARLIARPKPKRAGA